MDLGNGFGHLTYSTLVHPGDTWPEMWNSLITYVPRVKARWSPDKPFGVSLRLSASSAATLTAAPEERQKLKRFLDDNDMYLYTVNAFPYGAFKGEVVKLEVYEPDWSTRKRTELRQYGKTDWDPGEGEHASIEDMLIGTRVYANLILDVCNRTREEMGIGEYKRDVHAHRH